MNGKIVTVSSTELRQLSGLRYFESRRFHDAISFTYGFLTLT